MSVDPIELKARWKGVVGRFPVWRMPLDLAFDPSSWRMVGADLTMMVVESRNARRAAQALEEASLETMEALAALAKVNESRSGDLFRIVLLTYVSIPLAFAAMLSDSAPDVLRAVIAAQTPGIVVFLIGTVVFPVLYFCGNWRAKQISWLIELYRAGAIAPLPEANARR